MYLLSCSANPCTHTLYTSEQKIMLMIIAYCEKWNKDLSSFWKVYLTKLMSYLTLSYTFRNSFYVTCDQEKVSKYGIQKLQRDV